MTRVFIRIQGGLGNQLFQYAAARAFCDRIGADLYIDAATGFGATDPYNREFELDAFSIRGSIFRSSAKRKRTTRAAERVCCIVEAALPGAYRTRIRERHLGFDPELLPPRTSRSELHLTGYFQSEKYFIDAAEGIRTDLQLSCDVSPAYKKLCDEVERQSAIGVHVRLFDEMHGDAPSNVPATYYRNALDIANERFPSARVFVFSTRPDLARALLGTEADRAHFVDGPIRPARACEELMALSKCQVIIGSNSTFSWWAAWFNSRVGALRIVPSMRKTSGVGAWGFPGLIPEGWLTV